MHLLRINEERILESEELSETISILKDTQPSRKRSILSAVPLLNRLDFGLEWSDVIRGSREEIIDARLLKFRLAGGE